MNKISEIFNYIVESFSFMGEYYPLYLHGAKNTIIISLFTVLFGVIFGTVLALMKMSKVKLFKGISSVYIEIIRGTPLYVQILILYYGFDKLFGAIIPDIAIAKVILGMSLSDFLSCVLTLTINSSAYVAEVVRSGIQAVDKGQMEAARSIGMTHKAAMKEIIIPQAIKNILPALGNEFVVVIKESAIISVVAIQELMRAANITVANTYQIYAPLLVVAFIYFVMTFSFSRLLGVFERRLSRGDTR